MARTGWRLRRKARIMGDRSVARGARARRPVGQRVSEDLRKARVLLSKDFGPELVRERISFMRQNFPRASEEEIVQKTVDSLLDALQTILHTERKQSKQGKKEIRELFRKYE